MAVGPRWIPALVEVQPECRWDIPGVRVLGHERGTDNLSSVDQRDRSSMSVMVRLRPPGRVPVSANRCDHARSDARLSAGGAGDLPRACVVALGESPPKGREILSGQLIDGNNAIALIIPGHRYIVASREHAASSVATTAILAKPPVAAPLAAGDLAPPPNRRNAPWSRGAGLAQNPRHQPLRVAVIRTVSKFMSNEPPYESIVVATASKSRPRSSGSSAAYSLYEPNSSSHSSRS